MPRTVHDCPDHEDNLVLGLAAEVGAMLMVPDDTDLRPGVCAARHAHLAPLRSPPRQAPCAVMCSECSGMKAT